MEKELFCAVDHGTDDDGSLVTGNGDFEGVHGVALGWRQFLIDMRGYVFSEFGNAAVPGV